MNIIFLLYYNNIIEYNIYLGGGVELAGTKVGCGNAFAEKRQYLVAHEADERGHNDDQCVDIRCGSELKTEGLSRACARQDQAIATILKCLEDSSLERPVL
jgi:hypothetical protein